MSYFSDMDICSKEEPPTDWVWEQFGYRGDGYPKKKSDPEIERIEPDPCPYVKVTCRKCGITNIFEIVPDEIRYTERDSQHQFAITHDNHGLSYYFMTQEEYEAHHRVGE